MLPEIKLQQHKVPDLVFSLVLIDVHSNRCSMVTSDEHGPSYCLYQRKKHSTGVKTFTGLLLSEGVVDISQLNYSFPGIQAFICYRLPYKWAEHKDSAGSGI